MKRRTFIAVGALLIAQAAALAVYFGVESSRDTNALSAAPPRPASGQIDSFEVTMRDDTVRDLVGDRPVLVHFWGTWCPPCIEELPLVLGLPGDLPFDIVAVALDDDWSTVDAFVEDASRTRVALANRKSAERMFELSSLPQTILLSHDGRLLLRVNGARDWNDAGFLAHWTAAVD